VRTRVGLAPLDAALRPAVLRIEVAPEQVRFGGVPASSVGYFQLDRNGVPGAPSGPQILGLRALAIDLRAQGQGVGAAAMAALPAYVRERFPERRTVALTVNDDNPAAIALYARAGFVDAGVGIYRGGRSGPQHVLLLDVR
jgi:RimJ/RimL family protein N-acetyltransferase